MSKDHTAPPKKKEEDTDPLQKGAKPQQGHTASLTSKASDHSFLLRAPKVTIQQREAPLLAVKKAKKEAGP